MTPDLHNRDKISYTILRVVWKLFAADRKTRYYGTDQPLHEAEIHMIKAIKEHEGIHVTGLAEALGVTKGAVSQILMKLARKGMIVKDRDADNQSRLVLRLSPKGETAHIHHEQFHQIFDDAVGEILGGASEAETVFLKGFFTALERKIDEFTAE